LLRYLNPETAAALADGATPQIGFNYLGRFPGAPAAGRAVVADWATAAEADALRGGDADMPMPHALNINARTLDGADGSTLTADFAWPEGLFTEEDIRALAEGWRTALESLARHAATGEAGGPTPSDLPLVSLTQAQIDRLAAGTGGAVEDILPLSPLQEGLLFHALFDREALDVYTLQLAFDLEGPFDAEVMRAAGAALLRRHANLRAAFVHDGIDTPVQVVPAHAELPWYEYDLAEVPAAAHQAETLRILEEDRTRRFDLAAPPLLRLSLIRLGADRFRFVLTGHHILLDGWSMPLLVKELFQLYVAGGDENGLPRVTPYRDYLAHLATRDRAEAERAWAEALDGLDEPTLLAPAERGGDPVAPEYVTVALPEQLSRRLTDEVRRRGLTMNNVVQSVWALLLGQLTGRDDVVFGTTVAGRPPELPGVESMIGLFINTLPVRVRIDPAESLLDLVTRVQREQTALIDHQHLGLAGLQRTAGLGELFDTTTVLESYPVDPAALRTTVGGMSVLGVEGHNATHYPLSLIVIPGPRLRLRLEYRPDVLTRDEVDALLARLRRLFTTMATDPARPVARIDLLSTEEHRRLAALNDTAADVPAGTYPALFERWAAEQPDATALVVDGEELTYRELNDRANALARLLIQCDAGPERVVAFALPRCPELVVTMLAVLKSGSAYLSIDPDYPVDRIDYMLRDARPALVVTDRATQDRLPARDGDTGRLVLDDPDVRMQLESAAAAQPWGDDPRDSEATTLLRLFTPENPPSNDITDADRTAPLHPAHPAYLIYTSGSTGRPKGVVVSHAGLASLVETERRGFGVGPGSRVLQFASPSFDTSVWEFCMGLLTGATLVMATTDERTPGEPLERLLTGQRITHATIPPAALAVMSPQHVPQDLAVIVAGEASTADLIATWSANRPMYNSYGPSETTVDATLWTCRPDVRGTIPIGTPVVNTRVFVLDGALRPVPVGVAGELYVSGVGLARGYWGR
ncbi:condensation domain-containing protein, partial [Streptomyces sp. NPDC048483]|uniref:condensation domain-containing protein n=1 Tax=Streptomyces sp. NPDC048483 TaxID=3154927 RepID=UPI003438F436